MPQSVDLAPAPRKMQQGLLGGKTGKNHKNTWDEGCEDAPVLGRCVSCERGSVRMSHVGLEGIRILTTRKTVRKVTKPCGSKSRKDFLKTHLVFNTQRAQTSTGDKQQKHLLDLEMQGCIQQSPVATMTFDLPKSNLFWD